MRLSKPHLLGRLLILACLGIAIPATAQAAESKTEKRDAKKADAVASDASNAEETTEADTTLPLAKFLTVRSPIEDVMASRVKNLAVELNHQADRGSRKAFF